MEATTITGLITIIMECLVGWDFTAKRQGKPGIFGKVLGWSDTTEEQAKFTLHSHVLLFISEFDTLVSLLWSKNEKVRDEAKKELERYMKKTMSSTYNLSEEDYIHKKPQSSVETCELPEVSFLTSVKSDNATNTTFIWDDRVWGLGYHDPDKVSFFTGYYESRCPVETI